MRKNQDSIGSDDIALIGEDNTPVSMQLVQSLYNEITGKTENLSAGYRGNYIISGSDLKQLNLKITQMYEQYHVESNNCSITVFHKDDKAQRFSSFQRFELYDTSIVSPVEAIELKYNMLIKLPKTDKLQAYTFRIVVKSGLTILNKVREENESVGQRIFIHSGKNINVKIEYIDYTVAKVFQDSIESWVKCLEVGSLSGGLNFFKKHPNIIKYFIEYGLIFYLVYIIYTKIDLFIPHGTTDLNLYFKFSFAAFFLFLVAVNVSDIFARKAQRSLSEIFPMHYINLNNGDKKQATECGKQNKGKLLGSLLSILGGFSIGVVASIVANLIV